MLATKMTGVGVAGGAVGAAGTVAISVGVAGAVGPRVTVGIGNGSPRMITSPSCVLPARSFPVGSPKLTAGAVEKAIVAVIGVAAGGAQIGVKSSVTSASVSGKVAMGGEKSAITKSSSPSRSAAM